MAQITELKHEDRTRRRNTSGLAVVGVAVLVVGAGWLTASQLRATDDPAPTDPLSTPSASASAVTLEAGATVGARLEVPLMAKAPKSWTVWKDGAYVNVGADRCSIEIDGPLLKVFDPQRSVGISIPAGGYAQWLREHPSLTVVDDRMVDVDGREFPQLVLAVNDDASGAPGNGPGVALGRYADMADSDGWQSFDRGAVVTQTVIEVDGKTMVVTSFGALDDAEQAEQDAALDLILATMQLPS